MIGKGNLRILVIDDDYGCRNVSTKFLKSAGGYIVESAENGEEGLIKAARFKPDLILLDMYMPGLDGLQVMDKLCANSATLGIPVMIITGADLDDKERADLMTRSNFRGLKQKPVNFVELLREIPEMSKPATAGGRRQHKEQRGVLYADISSRG